MEFSINKNSTLPVLKLELIIILQYLSYNLFN